MAKKMNRVLSLLMAVMMVLGALPVNAFAAGENDFMTLVCDKTEVAHTVVCYEHAEECYHKHTEPGSILGVAYGCGYVGCTEHTHSVENGCAVDNCDAHAHVAHCCAKTEHVEHGNACYAVKQTCSHGWMVWKCKESCYEKVLKCELNLHTHGTDCEYTCGQTTDHTHDADCFTCDIAEHTHDDSCQRDCGKTTESFETLVCNEATWLAHTSICQDETHHSHSLSNGCYLPGEAVKSAFYKATGVEIQTTDELASVLNTILNCKSGCGYEIVSVIPEVEIEMELCEEHFCELCHRLNDGYCACVEITFANVGNVADAVVIVKVKNGETVPADKVPAADVIDFHFLGWFDAYENEFSTEVVYTEDITFTAKYQALAEYEKLQNTIDFIKNNFDLGTELGRLITILSNGEITRETVLENKDEAVKAIEAYLVANMLTGKISREQATQIVDLMNQGDEYVLMVAEWLWPEGAVMMPTVEEILEKIDFEKLSSEIKDMIAEKYGVEFDEKWIENNKELADQYIKECLEEVKSITEEQKIIIRDQIENEKAHAVEIISTVRSEMRDAIKAEIEHAKEVVNTILADREMGLKIGAIINKVTGLNNEKASDKSTQIQGQLISAIRLSTMEQEHKDALIRLMNTGDTGIGMVINWLWPVYTVEFVNGDIVIESDIVEHGAMPSFDGETPVKAADAQYTYTFAGWDKDFSAVIGDVTYTAVFTSTLNEYVVIFANEDGTVLLRTAIAYGEMPAFEGEPAKAADAQYTYTFAGWDKEITAVTGDVTYTAVFNKTVNEYTVTFENEDGTVLQSGSVAYGEMPAFEGEPAKAADAQYTYTFAGWDKEITTVTGDVTYTAVFNKTVNMYTINFVGEDGTVLQSSEIAYGEMPAFNGETPVKAADAKYTYTFAGWDKEITTVTGDVTYTAVFEATVIEYTVTFVDGENVISSEIYAYGDKIVVPELPTRDGYVGEWSCEIPATVEGNLNVEVVWNYEFYSSHKLLVFVGYGESATDKTLNWFKTNAGTIYNVRSYYSFYENGKYTGSSVLTEGVDYESYTANPGNITVDGVVYGNETGSDFYVINECVVVATKAEYHLDCHATLYHTVTFKDHNGNVIDTVTVQHGEAAEAPEMLRKGYIFTGWSEDISKVTNSMEVTPLYTYEYFESAKLKINVGNGVPASGSTKGNYFSHWGKIYNVRSYYSYYETYKNDSIMSVTDFDYERTAVDAVPRNVKVNGVTYTNGKGSSENYYVLLDNGTYVSCKAEYHLDYKASFYNVVTFVVDGVEYKVDVLNGTAAECPVTPVKEGYEFTGWDADFSKVTNSMTVNAQFEIKTYTVTFYLPRGGNTKVTVNHGDQLEEFIPAPAAGEEFLYWYNSKGGAKLDYNTPITSNMAFSAKCRWIIEDHDVTLMGVLNGKNYNLGMAVFEDSYHARKYSDKWLTADQYDPAKIILPDELNSITVDGVTYTYGKGSDYYTVEFSRLDSHMEKGYSYRYYGDVTLYHKLVTVYLTVDGQITGRTILRNVEHGTVATRELLGLAEGQFLAEELVINESGTVYAAIKEHADRFDCRDAGTLVMVGIDNGVYKYECTHCYRNFRSEDGNLVESGVSHEMKDREIIVYGLFGTTRVEIGTAVIKKFRAADSFNEGALNFTDYAWTDIVLPEQYQDISVNGVTYTYGAGSSANYYTLDIITTLYVENVNGEKVYTCFGELTLFNNDLADHVCR